MDQVQTAPKAQNRSARELDTRQTMQRPEAWRPPETLPMPEDRPGWKHRYVRISTMGQADPSNISSKLREGYEPCKAEDYPELMMHGAEVRPRKPVLMPFSKGRHLHSSEHHHSTQEIVDAL